MRAQALTLAVLVLLLQALACRQRPLSQVDPLPFGVWRVGLTSPGGELPFFLDLSREAGHISATLINGAERVTTSDVAVSGRGLVIDFRAFNSRISASLENGFLVGSLSVVKRGGTRQMMPLRAVKGQTERFAPLGEPAAVNITGRWGVAFRQADGTITSAVGEFKQSGSNLTGTFLTPSGDYRFLEGDVVGSRVRLSTFDGYHAFLFDARVDDDGVMRGDFWSGTKWHETWEAARDESASLTNPDALTYLKPGTRAFTFAFPDTTGELVSLADSEFVNKVVVVTIAGTWSPNCHDEAAFLAPFYRENRQRDVEVVALLYEHLDDFDAAVARAHEFARRHHIEYPLLIAGTSERGDAQKTLPMLNHIMAYPTTVFIDRQGTVRRIHTGFTGPGTGSHYLELVKEYSDYVAFLLSESPV
jgi:peroxiredoxin